MYYELITNILEDYTFFVITTLMIGTVVMSLTGLLNLMWLNIAKKTKWITIISIPLAIVSYNLLFDIAKHVNNEKNIIKEIKEVKLEKDILLNEVTLKSGITVKKVSEKKKYGWPERTYYLVD